MVAQKLIRRENYFEVLAYLEHQTRIMQSSKKTIKRKWAHLLHLLNWAGDVPFQQANNINTIFPKYLLSARNDNIDKPLSASSMKRACGESRAFFNWLKLAHPGKFQSIKILWILSLRPARENSTHAELIDREYYSLEDIRKLTATKEERLIDKRDRAAVAMLFISGMRISAFLTLPIYCVDLDNQSIDQFPSEGVQTKNSKAARTFLLPIDDLVEIVHSWNSFILKEFGAKAYWYPNLTSDGMGLLPDQMKGNIDSRRISFSKSLRRFCKLANISYRSPHKIRNGHGVHIVKQAENIEQFKAYSQNMMHESMEITDRLYGRLSGDNIKAIVTNKIENSDNEKEALFNEFLEWQQNKKRL